MVRVKPQTDWNALKKGVGDKNKCFLFVTDPLKIRDNIVFP